MRSWVIDVPGHGCILQVLQPVAQVDLHLYLKVGDFDRFSKFDLGFQKVSKVSFLRELLVNGRTEHEWRILVSFSLCHEYLWVVLESPESPAPIVITQQNFQ